MMCNIVLNGLFAVAWLYQRGKLNRIALYSFLGLEGRNVGLGDNRYVTIHWFFNCVCVSNGRCCLMSTRSP